MPFNISPDMRRRRLLAARVSNFPEWELRIACAPCGRQEIVPMTALPDVTGIM